MATEAVMRIKSTLLCVVLVLAISMTHCGKSSGPAAPELAAVTQDADGGALVGTVTSAGTNPLELTLEIRPQKWNTDWVNSMDEVQGRIYGDGFDTVVPESIIITGPTGAIAYPDYTYEVGGTFFKAFFSQQQAIALLDNPQRGDTAEIQVTGTNEAGDFNLEYTITVIGKKTEEDEGALTAKIKPKKWNTNWTNSEGYVTVQVRGDKFQDIVPETVRMSYGSNDVGPIKWAFAGNHFSAKFAKKEAIGLFINPKRGDTFEIIISGEITGLGLMSDTYLIEIKGKKK